MKIRLLFIPLILLVSCSQSDQKPKDQIISEQKMIDILVDVQISETYFKDIRNINNKETQKLPPHYYTYIFEKHEVTKDQFDESLKFYQEDLPKFKALFDSVIVRLEAMQKKN